MRNTSENFNCIIISTVNSISNTEITTLYQNILYLRSIYSLFRNITGTGKKYKTENGLYEVNFHKDIKCHIITNRVQSSQVKDRRLRIYRVRIDKTLIDMD